MQVKFIPPGDNKDKIVTVNTDVVPSVGDPVRINTKEYNVSDVQFIVTKTDTKTTFTAEVRLS